VVVHKKNGNLHIFVDFKRLNVTIYKGGLWYGSWTQSICIFGLIFHQIMITLEDKYKTTLITKWGIFVWLIMPFELKNAPTTYQWVISMAFKEYLGVFMKLFLDDFNVFNDLKTHMVKLQLCFDKCRECDISLNLENCMFMVFSSVILGYIVFKGSYQILRRLYP
jgi:hypothetical protein